MKKNSKKRILLSSVAMLMVGAISLGTATYAWFTQTTEAYGNNINVTSSKASSLRISDSDKNNWRSTVDYNFAKTLYATSTSDGVNWYRADAKAKESYEADEYQRVSSADSLPFYRFEEMLNVSNQGVKNINDVKYKFTFKNIEKTTTATYVRVAFIPCDSNGNYGTKEQAAFLNESYIFAPANADTEYQPIMWNSARPAIGAKNENFSATEGDYVEFNVADVLEPGDAKYYKLFVWFEGQDDNCIDANEGQTLDLDIVATGTPEIAN